MKKHNINYKHIGILFLFYIVLILIITNGQYIWASNVDFIKQHATFPDYFRSYFYQTGNLFPDFAPHLGAGENIFYIAYYGFLNPIILISYFLPFISMSTYIMISSICLNFISTILLYFFLQKNAVKEKTSFFGSLLFLFSGCLLFHSHRHIMFINYMPFLLLALLGVKKMFEQQKSGLLIISILLMILTSFYFSIPGILALCFYGLYIYLKQTPKITVGNTIKNGLKLISRIFLGILLSAFFLLPVAFIILHGRNSNELALTFTSFLPNINLDFLMYDSYGVGATAILWLSIIYHIFFSTKENRILALCLTITCLFPIFNALLNGGLYLNGKCFIPLLPLYILLIAKFIEGIKEKEISWFPYIIGLVISFLFLKTSNFNFIYFILDIICSLIAIFWFTKRHQYRYLMPILVIAFATCIIVNKTDNLITYKEYQTLLENRNAPYEKELSNNYYRLIENNTNNINYSKSNNDYRLTMYSSTTNPYYMANFYNTFNNNDIHRNQFMLNETNNLFFQRFMGVKYMLTNKIAPYAYTEIKSYQNASLYETNNVLPIAFASNHLLNKEEYNNLDFNEQLESFGKNIIINGQSSNPNLNFESQKSNLDYEIKTKKNIEIESNANHYLINSKKNGQLVLNLTKPIENQTLIIRFKMNKIPSCQDGDTSITINGITNKLTCSSWKYYNNNETFDYVLSSNNSINTLNITFAKGSYDLSSIQTYLIPNTYFDVSNDEITPLEIETANKKNTILKGTIELEKNGYFLFTIPYDEGFTVKVDGKEINYEMAQTGFIGFPLTSGQHKVELIFHAPWKKIGIYISIIASITSIYILFLEKRKKFN